MMHGTPAPGAEPATTAGSSNSSQPSPRLWRATSQPCLQKTSRCQQTETAEESAQPPSRAVILTTPSPDMKSVIPLASRFKTARLSEQYKSSFFVRTVADWNQLEDTVVTADSVTAFSSAVGRVLQGAASHTKTARAKTVLVSFFFLKDCTITNRTDYSSLSTSFIICIALSQLRRKNGQKCSLQCMNPDPDSNTET